LVEAEVGLRADVGGRGELQPPVLRQPRDVLERRVDDEVGLAVASAAIACIGLIRAR